MKQILDQRQQKRDMQENVQMTKKIEKEASESVETFS